MYNLQPSQIHFTQDSIASNFSNGTSVHDTIDEVKNGFLNVDSIEPIRVFNTGRRFYSPNNRRLYVFRVLETADLLATITVVEINSHQQRIMLTPGNSGCHVRVRGNGQQTYRHCQCRDQNHLHLLGYQERFPEGAVAPYHRHNPRGENEANPYAVAAGVVGGLALIGYGIYQLMKVRKRFSPSSLKFSQDSIGGHFRDGKNVNETILKIAAGKLNVSDIPHIEVKKCDGSRVSSDNRRLYVFRVLHLMGILDEIEVDFIEELRRDDTTRNAGCHVFVRGGETYQHCTCGNGQGSLPGWWDRRYKRIQYGRLSTSEQTMLNQSENNAECLVM